MEKVFLRAALTVVIGLLFLLVAAYYGSSGHFGIRDLLVELVREIGFAVIVAIVIWLIFEYFSSRDREEVWEKRISDVTKNVFYAVLGRKLPDELIDAANSLVLHHNFIRERADVVYVLKPSRIKYTDGTVFKYLEVHGKFAYTITNISSSQGSFDLAMTLSGHALSEVNNISTIKAASVRQAGTLRPIEISDEKKAEFTSRVTLLPTEFHISEVSLAAGESVDVVIEFLTPKDMADTEVLTLFRPTKGLSITIIDESKELKIECNSIHPKDIERDIEESGVVKFSLNSFILPHQGVQFWWSERNRRP